MGCTSLEEEMNIILKVKNMQVFLERKVAWTKKNGIFGSITASSRIFTGP
jgi:hypothetical protein